MKKLTTLLLFFLLIFNKNVLSQSDVNVYSIYEDQYSNLLRTRGVSESEIIRLFEKYNTRSISNDLEFAALLQKIYPDQRGIGVLFYFYNNDSLRIAFFEPGKLIETKIIAFSKKEIMQLGLDMNNAMDLYSKTNNRSPVQRGTKFVYQGKTKQIGFDSIIKKATALLIPASFNKNHKHLLIVPALNIGTFPFHLLRPYTDNSFLIENCSFTIIPDLISLVALRSKVLKKSTYLWNGMELPENYSDNEEFSKIDSASFTLDNPLFVCNPAYPKDSMFIYPDLPGAEKEISAAIPFAKRYTLLRGDSATKESVIYHLTRSDVAYFATHGIADSDNPMGKSFLVLSGNDPYLTARDIMAMRHSESFPAMVILSACQTGLGKSMEAGIAGLARSFLLAGSDHVIMSLWNVDDEATAYLMNRFIYHLQQRYRFMPSEPLRQAILDTMKIYPKPSQWASFSLFGIDY